MDSRQLAVLAAKTMDDKKAEDLIILHIEEKASFADYFVLASGKSERQIGALADDVEDAFAIEGVIAKNIEGKKESGWILMDFGDVIVNVLTEEMRSRYNIEKVWADCEVITE
jgi:ribosome-associated protein